MALIHSIENAANGSIPGSVRVFAFIKVCVKVCV